MCETNVEEYAYILAVCYHKSEKEKLEEEEEAVREEPQESIHQFGNSKAKSINGRLAVSCVGKILQPSISMAHERLKRKKSWEEEEVEKRKLSLHTNT